MPDTLEELTGTPSAFWVEGQKGRFPVFKGAAARYDIAIVGGGWVGLFAAYELAKAGKKIILLDKGLIGGEASGHSGGLIIDKTEGDLRGLIRICGKNISDVQRILRASHAAMAAVAETAGAEGFDAGYLATGHIVGFRNPREAKKYLGTHEQLHALLPDLYPRPLPDLIEPPETGAAHFFKAGAVHAREGGVFDPARVVEGLLTALTKRGKRRVEIYEQSEVTDFEPASHGGVRLQIGGASLEAQHVIVAGGDTARCVIDEDEAFLSPQPVIAAMLASPPLAPELVKQLSNRRDVMAPTMCVGLGAPYYRFTNDGRLLFGSGARAGWNEFAQITKDVARDAAKVFPTLGKMIDLTRCTAWGRMLYQSPNDVPFAYGMGREKKLLKQWPEKPRRETNGMLRDLSIIGIAGLGGQGNNFGPYLGRLAARAILGDDEAYDLLRLFHRLAPATPFTTRAAKSRLALERKR